MEGRANERLRKELVLDNLTWRKIQVLSDVRNVCCHAKDKEPSPDDVKELIEGVKKAIKTVS